MNKEDIKKFLNENEEKIAFIKEITEADYGCEERIDGEPYKVRVVLITKNSEIIREIPEDILIKNGLDDGVYIDKKYKEVFKL